MIDQISQYFTTEMIFIWLNIGVIPFWLVLIVFPQSNICKYLLHITKMDPTLLKNIEKKIKENNEISEELIKKRKDLQY